MNSADEHDQQGAVSTCLPVVQLLSQRDSSWAVSGQCQPSSSPERHRTVTGRVACLE